MKDITSDFIAASNALKPGQLVKDEHFTLFEAVGALEIMDSKMDTGFIPADEAEDSGFDFKKALSARQAIWIMDEMLTQEISWLDGYPLSQTIFTSVHIDRITDHSDRYHLSFLGAGASGTQQDDIVPQILHTFASSLLKTCSMALDLIRSQSYCEEEDFVTHLFGRELIPGITSESLLARLDDAISELSKSKILQAEAQALKSRLLFRKCYLQSIFGQYFGWEDMMSLLRSSLNDTHILGEEMPEAFTYKVQRRLATSTPPRPELNLSWTEACQKWTRLCEDVSEATRVTAVWVRQSPQGLHKAMSAFASRQASTLPRAILQDIVFVDSKIADDVSHFDLLTADVRELVLPGDILLDVSSFSVELPSDPRHKASRVMDSWLDGVLDEFMNMYRVLCSNRCRVRRGLTQLVAIFETLEIHSADYDAELESIRPTHRLDTAMGKASLLKPLQTWARFYKLRIMAETILMGCETEIYLVDELGQMYWYLSFLLGQRRNTLAHIQAFTSARHDNLSSTKDSDRLLDCICALDWYSAMDDELAATQHIATAIWLLNVVLRQHNLIHVPHRSFAEPLLFREARMRPYLQVKDPAPPTPEDFVAASIPTKSNADTMASINAEVKLARQKLNDLKARSPQTVKCVGSEMYWRKEVKQLETTCVALSVLVTQITNALKTTSEDSSLGASYTIIVPPPEKRYHPWWIVPQLKAKT